MELRVEYVSIMAQAQKLVGLGAQERLVGYVGQLVALGRGDAMDKLNIDRSIDDYADMCGASARIVRSDEEVAAIRQQRQQAAEAQQAMLAAQSVAKSAKDLSQADLAGDNALASVVDGG